MSDENDWLGDLPGIREIFRDGVAFIRRKALDFKGTGWAVVDNPATGRTDVSIDLSALASALEPAVISAAEAAAEAATFPVLVLELASGIVAATSAVGIASTTLNKGGWNVNSSTTWRAPSTGWYEISSVLMLTADTGSATPSPGLRVEAAGVRARFAGVRYSTSPTANMVMSCSTTFEVTSTSTDIRIYNASAFSLELSSEALHRQVTIRKVSDL